MISAGFDAGILEGTAHRVERAFDQVAGQLFELGAGQGHHQVLRSAGIGSDVRQVDLGLHHGRELDLGFLGGFFQPLQGLAVFAQVDAVLAS